MMTIFKLSPFVKNQFNQSPELKEMLNSAFNLETDWQQYQHTHQHLDAFCLLRKYRQSRLALIAARDLQNNQPTAHLQTLKQTSHLAQLLINHAYKTATQEFETKFGEVLNSQAEKQSFMIFALGKLGGHELNYSSDVDLVFCYSGNGVSNAQKSLEAQSYFQRLGRRIIQILDSVTADGIVYRVDMRLRPFGSASPLVCSIGHLLHYLESEGRDWERYAWLRASVVAGNLSLGENTLKQIEPFIYRKYLDYNIFASLRQIKEQIVRKQMHDLDNIKLGTGGIREIEFIVQTLQLTFAGRNKQLRGNDLWLQMHRLQEQGHLSVNNLQQLTAGWLFLRQLENLCQIIQDRDSHHLPENILPLAQCMGLNDAQELLGQLAMHRNNVHAIFENLFLSNKIEKNPRHNNPKIQNLKDQVAKRNYPKQSKHKIYAAYDALSPYLEHNKDSETLLERYQQVISAISTRSSYLSMLIESPIILEKLINQITHSAYFSTVIAKTPALLETLFDSLDSDDFDIEKQWRLFSGKHSTEDDEQYLEHLCQFKQNIQFKAISAYIDEINDAQRTSLILSNLAEKLLSLVVIQAHKESQQSIQTNISVDDLIVVGYGSLAMRNMHLDSDFDLVFILNQDITDNNHKFIMRWIKRIIHLLTIQTYSGSLYQIDTQLRPNGNAGSAIVTRNSFAHYQHEEAWIWEHAALIKTRAVYATEPQKNWFNELRKEILCQSRESSVVEKALNEMTEKLKSIDKKEHQSEFEYLGEILKNAHNDPEIINNPFINPQMNKSKLDKSIAQN